MDDAAASCGGRKKANVKDVTCGGRGGAGLGSWCSGTPAITTGWKVGGKRAALLINMIDDATSRWFARFVSSDSTEENMNHLERYLKKYGRPLAYYTDKAAIFQTAEKTKRDGSRWGKRPEELPPTQIGRALQELGIPWIAAHSPQAKGRVERGFLTAQDRLVKGLRVAGVTTIEGPTTTWKLSF